MGVHQAGSEHIQFALFAQIAVCAVLKFQKAGPVEIAVAGLRLAVWRGVHEWSPAAGRIVGDCPRRALRFHDGARAARARSRMACMAGWERRRSVVIAYTSLRTASISPSACT